MKTTPYLRRAFTVALPIASLGFFLSSQPLDAAVLVQYSFGAPDSPTLSSTTEALGVNSTAITPNGGGNAAPRTGLDTAFTLTNNPGANGQLSILQQSDGNTNSTTPPTDVDTNTRFISFTLSADTTEVPGATLSLTNLQLDYGFGGGSTRGFTAAFAVNGSADFTAIGTISGSDSNANQNQTTFTNLTFDIPAGTADDIMSAEFRLFTFANSINGRFMFLDNITVNGVPEPSSLLLLGGGIAGLLLRRRRA